VRLLRSAQRGSRLLRGSEKAYLDNLSLLQAICRELNQDVDRGTVRELFFLSALQDAGERVFYSKDAGGFRVGEVVFEVGGRNKEGRQVRQAGEKGSVAKDDVLGGGRRELPLHLFGFLYWCVSGNPYPQG